MSIDQTGSFGVLSAFMSAKLDRGDLQIPMLPTVATRVVSAASDQNTSARDMAKIILADPALAAQVMKVVTSAAYRPAQPIESLHHAISWLGMTEVCELAFTAAVQGRLLNVPRQRLRVERLWGTAVGAAVWSRLIAEACGRGGESSYLAGLLHEIGVPVCLQACADLAQASALPLSEPVLDGLLSQFKVQIGVRVAREWKLPDSVLAVVENWARWSTAEQYQDACAVTYLAHVLAEHSLAGHAPLALALLDEPVVQHLGLHPAQLTALVAESPRVSQTIQSFRS